MIGYYVHHQGSGHLQQMRCIADELRTPVTVLSSIPRPAWWKRDWITLPRDDAGTVADVTAGGVAHWAPLAHDGLRERGALITEWIGRAQPDLFVIDVSVEVAMLARLLGVPVVVAAMRGDRTDRAHAMAYDLAHALLAPWPSAFAVADWPERWLAKTWHVGAFSEFDTHPAHHPGTGGVNGRGRQKRVFLLWGMGGAEVEDEDIEAARLATPDWRWSVAGFDQTLSRSSVWEELNRADVIIAHAGQNVVAEVAAARKPAIIIAQPRSHREQVDTAGQLRRAGLAIALDRWPPAREFPSLLESATRQDPTRWRLWNSGSGAKNAARHLDRSVADLKSNERDKQRPVKAQSVAEESACAPR